MGYVSLVGPDGREWEKSIFGADGSLSLPSEIANDGYITTLEISYAREQLEQIINGNICGYGGPLGLGGWGGINEVCVQPWKLGGPAREQTPDGYSMKLKMRVYEEYRERNGYFLYDLKQTEPQDFELTVRWEDGKVRLYSGEPSAYVPPAPVAPTPDLSKELAKAGRHLLTGLDHFFSDGPVYSASFFGGISSLMDRAWSYFRSSHGSNEVAKNN
jgi:hypothetical protein